MISYRWVLYGTITVEPSGEDGALVCEEGEPYRSCRIDYRDGALLFDGAYLDAGDDFPCYLGIIDAAQEAGGPVALEAS